MSLLDPVLNPLLTLDTFWVVIILSLGISLIVTFIYKLTTNQNLMKQLKDELKELQKEMKELKDKPEEMMKVQQKAMQTNMKYMGQSMKSTLFTFLPLIFIFGWMNTHLGYDPLMPNTEFTTTVQFMDIKGGNVTLILPADITSASELIRFQDTKEINWILKGPKGEYNLEFAYNGGNYDLPIIITDQQEYLTPLKKINDNNIKQIMVSNQKKIVLNLLGWKLGWLGSYIIFSIIFSMLLRKLFKVY